MNSSNHICASLGRSPLRAMRAAICLAIFFCSCATAQENTLRVRFNNDPESDVLVGAFRSRGILYGSLPDLVEAFHVVSYTNTAAAKMEVKQGVYRIKVTGGNPFIVVTDQSQKPAVYQLPVNVIFAANTFFVPMQAMLPYFHILFNKAGTFDPLTGMLSVVTAPPPTAYDIPTISLEPKANGMVIRIPSQKKIEDVESWLRPDGWYYVTIADAKADVQTINAVRTAGVVKEIVAIQSPTSLQLTFKLAGKIASAEILRVDGSNDLLLSIRTPEPAEIPSPQPAVKKAKADSGTDLSSQRKRWELDVIVIDPGHGGYDPGTIGVTGVKEKDVTLGIARKLGQFLHSDRSELGDVKTVFTRSSDVFVPLYRRGQIANESGGKLFVSIHCNSTARKPNPQRGFEVYLLRPGRSEEAIAIAERENAVIELEEGFEDRYQQLTDENFILVAMAQSAYMRSSERLADLVQKQMASVAGLQNHGVKQAGFYVLVGAAMPNILVETAYLSNREDEKFLKSSSGQQKIAEAIYRAIRKYASEYARLLEHE